MIGEGGGFFVTLVLVVASGTGVIVVEIAAMGAAVVRVFVEMGLPGFIFWFSTALGVGGDFFSGYHLNH